MQRATDWAAKVRNYNLNNGTTFQNEKELLEHLCETVRYTKAICKILHVCDATIMLARVRFGLKKIKNNECIFEKISKIGDTSGMTVKEICQAIDCGHAGSVFYVLKQAELPFRYVRSNTKRLNGIGKRGRGRSRQADINWAINSEAEGYVNLWLNVLHQAIRDVNCKDGLTRQAARYWFKSPNEDFPSFIAICRHLDLDSDDIQRRIFAHAHIGNSGQPGPEQAQTASC